MISPTALAAALDTPEGLVDVSKIEFEVLENGTVRWLLWNGSKRLYASTLNRRELVDALQASGVLLRTMTLVQSEETPNGPSREAAR